MHIKLSAKIMDLTDEDLDDVQRSTDIVVKATAVLVSECIEVLHEKRMERLVRFCQTGSFE